MTRRRAIKKLMGMGMSRNEADLYLKNVPVFKHISYESMVQLTCLMTNAFLDPSWFDAEGRVQPIDAYICEDI